MRFEKIALIGFGEVGQALGDALLKKGVSISAFDLQFAHDCSGPSVAAKNMDVEIARTVWDNVSDAQLIISAVTAAQTGNAAQALAGHDLSGKVYLDLNSASPEAKKAAAQAIGAAGGAYIEASVMAPIEPKRLLVPILLGGPHAQAYLGALQALGFKQARVYSDQWGKASAAKLCRSVMIKGLEALIAESLLSARHYDVEAEVLASLNNLFPHPDWDSYAHYMITRTLEHGTRRAEEMREAAKTVSEAGIEPVMSLATAHRQDWAAQFKTAKDVPTLPALLDAVLTQAKEIGQ